MKVAVLGNNEINAVVAGNNQTKHSAGLIETPVVKPQQVPPANRSKDVTDSPKPSRTVTYNAAGTINKISVAGAHIDELIS